MFNHHYPGKESVTPSDYKYKQVLVSVRKYKHKFKFFITLSKKVLLPSKSK